MLGPLIQEPCALEFVSSGSVPREFCSSSMQELIPDFIAQFRLVGNNSYEGI